MEGKKEIEDILVCGLGGVGGYFGGRMAYVINNTSGYNRRICYLVRGKHLEQIKKNGLELHTSHMGNLICKPHIATNDAKEVPVPDLCFICVKSYDLSALIGAIKDNLSNETIIIPLMNGIDIYDRIRKLLKKGIVLPSCVYVGSHIEKPGLVVQSGNQGFIYSGFDPKFPDFNPKMIINFFESMGITFYWKDDPYPSIWEKFLLVSSYALVTAHTGKTLGEVIADRKSLELIKEIMKEIKMIAGKKNIQLPEGVIENIIELTKDYPKIKTSYQRDVEKGKQDEGDLFGGTIIRLGKELNVPTPITESLYFEIEKKKQP